ncbi:MAG: FAD-dependent oxidoreductase [Chroococcidiopsidaceae cyanobacterium CP_BM_ER_R8_30]|nr:FAD-dependent oxidoreductase [Chroococcidiopsidaceae cyanobacterium CP_BM_ER_R8_30]
MFDIAVVGAGMAGLVCAQQLTHAGYQVVVVEKSRGLGGRVATRRLHGTCADHGVCYLKPKGQLLPQLLQILSELHLLQVWTDEVYEWSPEQRQPRSVTSAPCYVAPTGMNAITKFLATGLEIWLNRRVQAITLRDDCWHLSLEPTNADTNGGMLQELDARAVVIAIPAPQALMLLTATEDLPRVFLERLQAVEFDPCFSVIAGYSAPLDQIAWKAVTFLGHPDLAWVGLDSSKRLVASGSSVFVLQSSAGFAERYLEAQDLQPVGCQLLAQAAVDLLPGLDSPDWMQVHRWRYAFPRRPWQETFLSAETPLPLICCGDWCGGNRVDNAIVSGVAAAKQINDQLQQRTLPDNLFGLLVNAP